MEVLYLKDLLELIAKNIVDNPSEVKVTKVEGSQSVILELEVADEDMGKVIGKKGRIAKAIRTVVKAAVTKKKKRVIVEIIQ
ncbi:KH domain-containing protein [Halobacteroides halobius]|uniref:KH domain-containing protein n=1 Tax=Halobacteroides halobius TaxID=42422 RepID=UPI003CCBAB34